MKMPQTKEVVGSAKALGLTLGGFIGGNVLAKTVNKDNWKINGLMAVISLLVIGATKKDWQKQLATGTGVYFGIKTFNNLTGELNGLSGVPDSVKEIINKYVPRLGEVGEGEAVASLSESERQVLLGYMGNTAGVDELLGNTPAIAQAVAQRRALPPSSPVSRNAFMCTAVNGLAF
jgi:hypothetical protein